MFSTGNLLTDDQTAILNRRVSAGAREMDLHDPRAWARKIHGHLDDLDVGSLDWCPLAILHGSYTIGLRTLQLSSHDALRLGFTLISGDSELGGPDPHPNGSAWDNEAYKVMTDAWRREVAGRMARSAGN